jgi:Zn-dependent protease
MPSLTLVQQLAVWALPLVLAITLHEVAHGWVARWLGDPTAAQLGRLTLNPIKHIDPIGTVVLPLVMVLLNTGFIFGWAKPVPVDWRNFKQPRRDMAVVAAAGPLANFAMAVGWGLLLKFALMAGSSEGTWIGIELMSQKGIAINLMLMVLNLLPLPPLDGGRVLVGLLPAGPAYQLSRIEPYGIVILLLLSYTSVLNVLMWPIYVVCQNLLRIVLGG